MVPTAMKSAERKIDNLLISAPISGTRIMTVSSKLVIAPTFPPMNGDAFESAMKEYFTWTNAGRKTS